MKEICRGMNQGEVEDVIFLWFFLSNRKFALEITAGMGSVQLLLFRSINILGREGERRSKEDGGEENQTGNAVLVYMDKRENGVGKNGISICGYGGELALSDLSDPTIYYRR